MGDKTPTLVTVAFFLYNNQVRKEVIITAFLLFVGVLFWLSSLYLNRIEASENSISPFSDSVSIYSLLSPPERPKYTVYGFLPYWTINKAKYLQFDKLTDIAYFGLNINADGTFRKYLDDGTTDPGYNNWINNEDLQNLITKSKKEGIRFSLTVISHESDVSDDFLMCKTCWNTLVQELFRELDAKKINSVNLNFEYADYTDGSYADRYTELTQFINNKLDERYGDAYVVVSTFADSLVKPRVTKVDGLAKVSDGLFIMAYDFHRPDSDTTGPVAPIGGKGIYAEYDIQTMLKDYLSNAPANKLILGVPYYGYNWVVTSPLPNSSRIPGNDYIGFSQSQSYEFVMDTILRVHPNIKWDNLGLTPYFSYVSPETGSTRQVYYENEESLKIKYQLAKNNHLAGVGIWALGYDGGYQELWNLLKNEFVR